MATIKAKALKPGDLVTIIAPASAPRSEDRVTKAVQYFEKLGYRVTLGKHLNEPRGYLAAEDKDRLKDIHAAFSNKKIKAVFFIRGGYGTLRLLPELDYDLIARNPKILVGYSDATSLINAIYRKTGLASMFYGPMPGVDIWDGFDPFAEENFWRALTSTKPIAELPMSNEEGVVLYQGNGSATGRLGGGNLTVFSSLCGTPYMAPSKNSILFFEDIDEKPYRCDRYFAQLRAMGALDSASAILLGQFTGCVADPDSPSLTIDEIFKDYFAKLKIPVIANLPSGHVKRQWTLPFGAKHSVLVSGKKAAISILESVLE